MGGTASLFQGLTQMFGAVNQAEAARLQGEYQQRMYNLNARLSELQAEDATRRGEKEASRVRRATRGLIGSQRAALAAQGIEIDSGSALDVQEDTAARGAQDALTVTNNAWREAWGYRVAASTYRYQGEFARLAGDTAATNTLVTGGLNFLKSGIEAGYYYGGGTSNLNRRGA